MGYVFDFKTARQYDDWFNSERNRFVADLQDQLLVRLLKPVAGERVIDIGCGTGRHLEMFLNMGLDVTGLDASPHMLEFARKRLGVRAELRRGVAEDLPFDDNTFNVATLITTLEFVEDSQKAIEEACRVTKDRIFLGVLNRYSIKCAERRIKGIFSESIYNRARFFSIWELTRSVRQILGKTPMRRGTVQQLPCRFRGYTKHIERYPLVQKSPLGSYIGMAVVLVPRYRTSNIRVDYVRKPKGAVSGLMSTGTNSRKRG
ncbi:MAG: class I SAM-dependent methyltransferase [Deltaproteobacteria bacterium]|nr:class I SAM-dependent methyltransferase [Deltaproteobacteria bacterium]MBW2318429.1 class I SAM-dependent methyltransferase [Deltaproteobacteria bacterium]